MIQKLGIYFIFCLSILHVSAQREYVAQSISDEITVDGELNEAVWEKAHSTSDFVVSYPDYGRKSKFKTEVKIVYDNEALYVGAHMIDPEPDSVSYSLSQRDDVGNADWFGFGIDPYQTNVTQFIFIVTSAGVEIDGLEYTSGPDYSWNAVWKSAVTKSHDGWYAEIRIPFSAIRFAEKEVHEWSFNMGRSIRRNRQYSTWNPVNPEVYGEITQSGTLKGIEDINAPVRLSLTPYVTSYAENSYDPVLGKQTWSPRITGGMDLKYGINDAFTLDMTLVPDFGQTTSDQKVLNLSPFEVQYNENRPFFIEGMDLFGIGDVFYTRRVGGTPFNQRDASATLGQGEYVKSNPSVAPLLNATKFSGRTKGGLGIGFFNAIERETYAIVADSLGNERRILTNPWTNYNVTVFSQNLKNNSSVSFLNTNVTRLGEDRDANVSVGSANLFSDDGSHQITSTIKLSNIRESNEITQGHSINVGLKKVSGTWGYAFNYLEISDKFNSNDLGYLYVNNIREMSAKLRWNDFTPGSYFLRKWGEVGVFYNELYKPQIYSYTELNGNFRGTTKNFLTFGFDGTISPFGEKHHFESRTFGKEVWFNPAYYLSGFYSSDYSKKFALDLNGWIKDFFGIKQKGYGVSVSPRFRVNDRMFLVWRSQFDYLVHDYGYVPVLDDDYQDKIILGNRNRVILENSLRTEFIFTKRMGIDLRFRHYWTEVDYFRFDELLDNGVKEESSYFPLSSDGSSAHNTSYNAFTIDVNYRWVFIPGSELRIVYKNNIFHSKSQLDLNYFNTFRTLFEQPQINSISLKLLVYIDAIYFRNKEK